MDDVSLRSRTFPRSNCIERAQPTIMSAAVKVLLASLRSTLTAEAEGWVFRARGESAFPKNSVDYNETSSAKGVSGPISTVMGSSFATGVRGWQKVRCSCW